MLKRTLFSLGAGAVMLAALGSAAWADWDHHKYDTWWVAHHDYAVELQAHPEYVRDHAWRHRHHDIDVWLNANPGFVTGYATNPYPIIVEGHHEHDHWHHYPDGHWGW